MERIIKKMLVVGCILFLGVGYSFAQVQGVSGRVVTLPITVGEEGENPTPVSSMPVVFNESIDYNNFSDENGNYTLSLPEHLNGSFYILHLDDNISVGDMSVPLQTDYIPTYTMPSFYGGNNTDHNVMILTTDQINTLGLTLQSGKGALFVLIYDFEASQGEYGGVFLTGATAVVRNMDGSSVGTVRYIALDPTAPLGITLSLSPVDAPVEEGGTFGFIAYNIDPGTVMVSATKSGYSFLWRFAPVYADSITCGMSMYDSIFGRQGNYVIPELTGILFDEEGNPVQGATITLCGMGKSGTTDSNGLFTLTNVPYPAIAIIRARKTGYKDTYTYGLITDEEEPQGALIFSGLSDNFKILQDGEEIPEFRILSDTFAENLGIDFTGGGVLAGMVMDVDGYPIKNAEVLVWDEYPDIPGHLARYIDCMEETIDDELYATSDSGLFVVDSIQEAVSLGISPSRPVYLSFEHEDTSGNTYSYSQHYIGFVFNNGITIIPEMEMNMYIGRIEISGDPHIYLSPPNSPRELFYMKLEIPEEEELFSQQLPPYYLKSFTITYEGVPPDDSNMFLCKKVGENWEEVTGWSVSFAEGNKIYITIPDGITLPAEILVRGQFDAEYAGEQFSCSVEKNCDVVVTTEVPGDVLQTHTVYVSVDGAPVEGNTIFITTEGASINVTPEQMDFGQVNVGESETLTLNIYNTGSVAVEVISSIEGTDAGDFAEEVSVTSTLQIGVGGNGQLLVTFTPTSTGTKSATLRLSYSGLEAQEDILIPLTGEGVSEGGGDGGGGGAGGCFIATAAFGSPLHRCVNILREFRDRYLVTNRVGKAFVRWYYTHSPAIARVIEKSLFLKMATRIMLLPLIGIAYIILNGVLPYLVLAGCVFAALRMKK